MRRQDRERMRGESSDQDRKPDDRTDRTRQPDREQVRGSSDEPRNKPDRPSGRMPLPE
jgi:hypothetical protein